MCGIAGILSKGNLNTKKTLNKFQKVLSHRGPDAKGSFIDSKNGWTIGLAHRRLSIIDLSSSGNQPMSDRDNSIHIVFNGEIYNYKELRKKLEKKYKFKSTSDTEVILYLYKEKGEKLLDDLRGMFAFAIWDSKKEKLFLARDRFGIKPIYYNYSNEYFVFASELKGILSSNLIEKNINKKAAGLFMLNGSIPPPDTIYAGISALEPGCFLIFQKGKLIKKEYYNPLEIFMKKENISEAESIKKIHDCLLDSVKYHLISDVPVGCFLSGGIDSSAIVALAREAKQKEIKTLSIIFPGTNYDESKYAKIVSDKFKTDHNEIEITGSDLKKHINRIFEYMDQPTVDGINSYFVSLAASRLNLKVVLSGLGGDEIFCGYNSFTQLPLLQRFSKIFSVIPFRNKIFSKLSGNSFDSKAKILSLLSSNSFSESYSIYRGIFNNKQSENLLGFPVFLDKINLPDTDYLSKVSFLELTQYMSNQLLRDTDVFSMAHSLEIRVPFVDHKLIELVAGIPSQYKIGKTPKRLLVKALGNKLPEEIVYRKKQGFVLPFELWMKEELKDFVEKKLERSSFDEKLVNKLLRDFYNKKIHFSKVWSLVVLSEWI